MDATTPCDACSASVAVEEVAQGLAVKVSGKLLCPQCLDRLPGDAKVLVNQMRALRGLAVTTYRLRSGRHPHLPLFTFTTSSLVLAHCRKLSHGERFEAPELPPPGSRPRLPTASEAARGDRRGWLVVGVVAIVVVLGLAWVLTPGDRPAPPPVTPAPPPPTESVLPPTPVDSPERQAALRLTELERQLREHPGEAATIADAAELLRDGLEPRAIGLRNRADGLAQQARALVPLPPPPPPAPIPEPGPPVALPEPVVPEPVVPDPEPPPVAVAEPPVAEPPPVVAPEPDPAEPPPVASPEPAPVQPTPDPPARRGEAVVWDPRVVWPERLAPLVSADQPAPPRQQLTFLHWPWPAGESIFAAQLDRRSKRSAIELRFTVVGPAGGVAIVVHPGDARRSSLDAVWLDGVGEPVRRTVALSGEMRWQTIVVSAAGIEALDPVTRRLRLEDAREGIPGDRPFLVGGAAMRAEALPEAADCPPRLPLPDPAPFFRAAGKPPALQFKDALLRIAGAVAGKRGFAVSSAKIALPEVEATKQADFRATLRRELGALHAELRRGPASVPDGNPADLPWRDAALSAPDAAWPAGLADLAQYDAVVLGWRHHPAADLERVLVKCLTPSRRPNRPALLPLLAVGELDRVPAEVQAALDVLWHDAAMQMYIKGIPVIDLRHAQRERSAETVRKAAARLVVDGLRQLDWLLNVR